MNSLFDSFIWGWIMKLREEGMVKWKWIIIIIFITLSVYMGFKFILPLIFPFIIAYFLAWLVRPITEWLHGKLKIPRIIGGTISLLTLFTLLCVGLYFLCNTLMKQLVAFVKNLPVYLNLLADKLDHICNGCDDLFGLVTGTARAVVDDNLNQMLNRFTSEIMPGITGRTFTIIIGMVAVIGVILIVFVAAVLIVKDLPSYKKQLRKYDIYQDIHKVTEKLSNVGIAYLRTQLIIMVIVSFVCVLGLTILKNDYALLLGLGIAFMDALPVLGSGIVFIPWSIIMLINGNIYGAAILFTTYLLCQIVREILEPKLIGNQIGIKPLFTLISMYIGVRLFSIAGFFLGPIGLIIIITIVRVLSEKHSLQLANKKDIPYNGGVNSD